MSPYRILFVIKPSFHPNTGGVQMSTFKMGSWFSHIGHKVAVVSFGSGGHIEQKFATLYSAPECDSLADEANFEALADALQQFKPDIVINQMPYEHKVAEVLRRFNPPLLLGCLRNTLFSVKNNVDQYGARVLPKSVARLFRNPIGRSLLLRRHRTLHRRNLRRLMKIHDYFVMFATPNIEELRYFVPEFDERKIKLIPNSIPTVVDELPLKEKRLLWLGRLSYDQKRADLILPLWQEISGSLPDWTLDIVGDGPALDDIRQKIETENIERVILYGQQEPDEYYSRASIFIMTSAFEGFPNTLVEAQSYGAIPVLFNSFPVAEWIVSHGVNGFLAPHMDVTAMASAVLEITRCENKRELMMGALENARRFQIETVGKQWQDLFSQSLDGRAVGDRH